MGWPAWRDLERALENASENEEYRTQIARNEKEACLNYGEASNYNSFSRGLMVSF